MLHRATVPCFSSPHFNKHNAKRETRAAQSHLCLDLYYFPPPLIMLPAERFLGSGHQTKGPEIEANFLWQAATTPGPRRHALHQASVSFYERIQDTFLFQRDSCTNSHKSLKKNNHEETCKRAVNPSSDFGLLFASFLCAQHVLEEAGCLAGQLPSRRCLGCWSPAATVAPKMYF